MLDEADWAEIAPLMTMDTQEEALERYYELTGYRETVFNALWHHRASLYGPLCSDCEKPLRSPKAGFCAACGAERDNGRDLSEGDVKLSGTNRHGFVDPRPFKLIRRLPPNAVDHDPSEIVSDYRSLSDALEDRKSLLIGLPIYDAELKAEKDGWNGPCLEVWEKADGNTLVRRFPLPSAQLSEQQERSFRRTFGLSQSDECDN